MESATPAPRPDPPRPGPGGAGILIVQDEPELVRALRQRTNYLRFHMARLRRKLEDNPARPRHLLTEPGMGYRYQP